VVEADSLHYQGDLLLNLAVIIALFSVDFGFIWMDAVMAVCIAVFLGVNAASIGKKAVQDLMDKQLPDVEDQVRELVSGASGGLGCHDVRCRQSGPNLFIQFHLELDANLSLGAAHAIGDQIEQQIKHAFPSADVIIHHDPVSV